MKKKKNLDKPFNFRLNDKVVLVTGASRGIGYEVSKSFLMNGSNLIICSKNLKKLRKSYLSLKKIKKKNQKIFYFKTDVSSETQIKKLIRFSILKFNKIDILVNNAGVYGPKGLIEDINWKKFIDTINVNLLGSIMLCREVIPYFKKQKSGKIIQLSGGGAAAPLPRINGYAVSKIGIVRFIESLSHEVKKYKIDVNAVAPGTINTNMLDEILNAGPKKIGIKAYKKALIQKKDGGTSYKEACDLILFLASKLSDGISGKLISAIWDDWQVFPKYKKVLSESDLFTLRRVLPRDRFQKWGLLKKKSIFDKSLIPSNKLKK